MTGGRVADDGPDSPGMAGLTAADLALLGTYREAIGVHPDALARDFEEHLRQHPAAVPAGRVPEQIAQLARRQAEHVHGLLAADSDPSWVARAIETGGFHCRLGVESRWLPAVHALCWQRWAEAVEQKVPADHRVRVREALFRLLVGDLAAQLDGYSHAAGERRDEQLPNFDLLLRALSASGVSQDSDSSHVLNALCSALVHGGAVVWAGYAVQEEEGLLTFRFSSGTELAGRQVRRTPSDPCWTTLAHGQATTVVVDDPLTPGWMKKLPGAAAEIICLPLGLSAPHAIGMVGSRDQGYFRRAGPDCFTAFVRLGDLVLRLRAHSQEDPLTGLPNRRFFFERLHQARIHNERRSRLLGVGMLDLDGFKQVNDRLGHASGDALLREIGARLKRALRAGDTLARMGGDEFGMLLPDLERLDDLEAVCERIAEGLREPLSVQGEQISVSASIGFTLHPLDDSETEGLLRHADLAMYAAKENGRDQYQLHNITFDARISDQASVREGVEAALRDGRLLLHYQPVVIAGSQGAVPGVVGFEALLRMDDGRGNLLAPADFGGTLDHGRLGRAIGRFVLEAALAEAQEWHRQGLDLRLCVNVSATHLLDPRFRADLGEALAHHPGVPAGHVEIEITESAPLRDLDAAQRVLEACRGTGVRIALDDFGTGNASLVYLQKMPAHTVKIDRCFVRDMLDDPRDLAIVSGLIMTARMLGLDVVAEGVETSRQAALLTDIQCRMLQGYFIARPMPAGNVPAWLQEYHARGGSDTPQTGFPPPAPIGYAADSIFRAHTHRVHQFLAALEGEEPFPALVLGVASEVQCHLGRWLEHEGFVRFGRNPAYPDLRDRHARTHHLSREARACLDSGRRDEALRLGRMLRTENDALMADLRQLLERGTR